MLQKKRRETQFIVLACGLYFICQISRTDLSAVLLDLMHSLGFSKDALGIAVTGGYITYAAGMLVNSLIAERRNPKAMICIAMFGCALTHIGIRLLPILPIIIALWCINGYLQSMIWPCLLRTVCGFTQERRSAAMSYISVAQHVGSVACYLFVPIGLSFGGWGTVMLATGIACLTCGFAWGFIHVTSGAGNTILKQDTPSFKFDGYFLAQTNLLTLLLLGVLTGMLRDGITTWAPVFYSESLSIEASSSILLTGLLPASKVLAYAVTPILCRKIPNIRKSLLVLYIVSLLSSTILLVTNRVGAAWASMSILLMNMILLMSGCASIIYMITLPIHFCYTGRSASISGFLDCSFYVGTAISTYVFAKIETASGWTGVIFCWSVIAAICIGIIVVQRNLIPTGADAKTHNKN